VVANHCGGGETSMVVTTLHAPMIKKSKGKDYEANKLKHGQ